MQPTMLVAKSATLERMYVRWTVGKEGLYTYCFGCEPPTQAASIACKSPWPKPRGFLRKSVHLSRVISLALPTFHDGSLAERPLRPRRLRGAFGAEADACTWPPCRCCWGAVRPKLGGLPCLRAACAATPPLGRLFCRTRCLTNPPCGTILHTRTRAVYMCFLIQIKQVAAQLPHSVLVTESCVVWSGQGHNRSNTMTMLVLLLLCNARLR